MPLTVACSAIQFQKGLSLSEFQRLYGTEEPYEAALEKPAGPMDSAVPAADAMDIALFMAACSSAISAVPVVIRPHS
jgi:hypothetical protein